MSTSLLSNVKHIYNMIRILLIVLLGFITIWVCSFAQLQSFSKEQLPNIELVVTASASSRSNIRELVTRHMHNNDHFNRYQELMHRNLNINKSQNDGEQDTNKFGIDTAPYDLSKLYIYGEEEYCDGNKYNLKYMDITGMYDTGTNTFYQVLTKNCWGRETRPIDYITAEIPREATSDEKELLKEKQKLLYKRTRPKVLANVSTFMNVKWKPLTGKHNVISAEQDFIDPHVNAMIDGIRDRLTLVIIKDPLTWFKSLCKASYEVHLYTRMYRINCPFDLSKYNGKFSANMWHSITFASLMDLWNWWYGTWTDSGETISVNWTPTFRYWNHTVLNSKKYNGNWRRWMQHELLNTDKRYVLHDVNKTRFDQDMYYKAAKNIPHVVIRYEDILFQPERLIKRLCKCVGGYLREGGPLIQEAAAKGHGEARGRKQALNTYGNPAYRLEGYSKDDIKVMKEALNKTLLRLFSYDL
eukprot:150182_1